MVRSADQAALKIAVNDIVQETHKIRSDVEAQYQATRLQILQAMRDLAPERQGDQGSIFLAQSLTDLSLHEESMRAEQAILDSLYSPQMEERHRRIVEAHYRTFDWIFQTPTGASRAESMSLEGSFTSWLETGNGFYWISGKAGSGKSTLMKLISGDVRTKGYLNMWAGSFKLITASFYFWNAGSSTQDLFLGPYSLCSTRY